MPLTFISHNTKGLNSPCKRKIALTDYKKKGADFILHQETHFSTTSTPKYFDKQYNQVFLSSAPEKKRGVAILVHNRVGLVVDKVKKDREGRFLMLIGSINALPITIATLYAPNTHEAEFFTKTFGVIKKFSEGALILGGDFNVAMNTTLDRSGPHKHKANPRPSALEKVAPEGHVSPVTEQVSSPGSASSTHLEEHDEEDFDDDDDDDDDDAAAAAIDTQIQASDHEEVPIETVLPPKRPANTTYDAIVASEGKIVEAENRRHSDLMTVLERMIALQEETVSQLAHLHRVFIEVPKQLQKINTSFEALVVQQTQANYWRMTNVPRFNTSQAGSVHAGQFSPHSSDIHSPGPNVTGQVADIAVQFPDDILPLPSVQIQQQTPTKEATKTKQDTHETDQPSLVQCLPTCSHVSVGTSPAREVPEATQSGSAVPKVGGKRKRKIQETTSRPVTRSQKEQKK
ncbi:uncharacterized protein LOC142501784 [Ascaphus truei]|uniref:uncharacterized protein LOC142501784 n=1 Tax=Ascaphus truei TaxID=8439 RepID=UPI003F599796